MNYLLDTCVISELIKDNPEKKVVKWINKTNEESLFLSVISIGELQKGVSKLGTSKRKEKLNSWIENELLERFSRRIIGINVKIARKWGEVFALGEKNGKKIPVIDALLGASALFYNLTVATRNIRDIEKTGVSIFNPWT